VGLVHDHDLVGDLQRLLLVMGHEDRGQLDLVVEFPQPAAQVLSDARVQGPEGLVEEKHLGLNGQGARKGHPLALAAGELGREAPGQAVQLHELQEAVRPLDDGGIGRPLAPAALTRSPKATFSRTDMCRKRA
jgi:hypothetical protein